MITIYVKPAPGLDPAAVKVLKSDTGVGLIDAAGKVPEAGMPWPNGGLTLSLLRDGVILRADDAAFAAMADDPPKSDPAPASPSASASPPAGTPSGKAFALASTSSDPTK